MSLTTPDGRRVASGIITSVVSPGIAPGLNSPDFRQSVGWGYLIPASGAVPEPPVVEKLPFVYRRRRRLRARKR